MNIFQREKREKKRLDFKSFNDKYSLFGVDKIIIFYFHFYAWYGMLLKGMGESFLLSEDEPLTPNIIKPLKKMNVLGLSEAWEVKSLNLV